MNWLLNFFKNQHNSFWLPDEIWSLIFCLPKEKIDVNNIALVCKTFYRILHKNPPPAWRKVTFYDKSHNYLLSILSNARHSKIETIEIIKPSIGLHEWKHVIDKISNSVRSFKVDSPRILPNTFDKTGLTLIKILRHCPNLCELSLRKVSFIHHRSARQMWIPTVLNLLKGNTSLRVLSLSDCGLKSAGAIIIAEILGTNQTIIKLDLSQNYIDPQGGHAIARSLIINKTLETLNLDNNPLISSTMAIMRALKVNYSLTDLNVGNNHHPEIYSGPADPAFDRALELNNTLTALNISITNEGANSLANALIDNFTLKELTIADHSSQTDFVPMLLALKINRGLRRFSIWNNVDMNDKLFQSLEEAIKNNTTLEEIYFYYHNIKSHEKTRLKEALKHQKTLKLANIGNYELRHELQYDRKICLTIIILIAAYIFAGVGCYVMLFAFVL